MRLGSTEKSEGRKPAAPCARQLQHVRRVCVNVQVCTVRTFTTGLALPPLLQDLLLELSGAGLFVLVTSLAQLFD